MPIRSYSFSALVDGQSYDFDPLVDVLTFDGVTISAADVGLSEESGSTSFTVGDKTITLLNVEERELSTTNVVFANGSVLRVGDGAATTLDDNDGNTWRGTANDDKLLGLGGNDFLLGEAGDDVLIGGGGNDFLDGGTGFDTVSYAGVGGVEGVTVSLALTSLQDTSAAGQDVLMSIEALVGSDNADILSGNALANELSGRGGNDTLVGGIGDDTLTGGGGDDVVNGGTGVDTASYSSAGKGVVVSLALAAPQPTGGAGADMLISIESLVGSDYGDELTGNTGTNVLDGGFGTDTLVGGAGNDTYVIDTLSDVVTEALGGGTDTVMFGASYALGANVENLVLTGTAVASGTGNALANRLTGNAGANSLNGGAANDTLVGGLGNDTLVGGLGNDALSGTAGKDLFRFDTAPNTLTNKDTIGDFSVLDDTIQLENAAFTKVGAVGILAAAAFWKSTTAIAAHDATDRVIYNTATGALYYDPDGTGPAAKVQFATLTGSPDAVTNADFQVT